MALTKVKAGNILLTTPAASSNDVTPATTAYVTTALANMVDSAPSTLNTLNELAAALGDDANFSTTVTNSIAAKLPLAGGTLTGDLVLKSDGGSDVINVVHSGNTVKLASIGQSSDNSGNGLIQLRRNNGVLHTQIHSHGHTYFGGGYVGIGFASGTPRYDLVVQGDSTTAIGIGVDNISGSSTLDIAALGTGYNNHQAGPGEVWFFSPDTINIGGATGHTNDVKFLANNSVNMIVKGATSRVGIGTTAPTMPLSVQAASNAYAISMHGRSDGYSELYGASNDGSTKYSFLQSHSAQTKLYTLVNTPLLFGTNSTERMRITNTGNVGIGNQAPNTKLYVEGPQDDTYGQLYIKGGSAANQDPQIAMGSNQNGRGFYIDDSAVNRFKIYTGHGKGASSGAYEFVLDNSGTIESKRTYANTTGAYSANVYVHTDGSFNRATSSRRYKKDIVDADKGLDEILQLKPRNYKPENNRIDSSEPNAEVNDPHLDAAERTFAGLIAEEVHDLGLTEYVDYEEDGTTPSGLYYGNMVALLVKGIQEQQTIIDDLKSRIETLEG